MLLANAIQPSNTTERLLNRATYGITASAYASAKRKSIETWLEEQFFPTQPPINFPIYHKPIHSLKQTNAVELQQMLRTHTIYQALYSENQLYEVMVAFWSDHFNISLKKRSRIMGALKLIDDREVIRPNALGKFTNLLTASVKSPAMLIYLDNIRNHARSPNENYARELLELHSLGIDGGYTHHDIDEVARILTGWSVIGNLNHADFGQTIFKANRHDKGEKLILGTRFPAGRGKEELADLIKLLVNQPATARFIAFKLAQRFVADEPPATLVQRASQTFQQTGGDIQATLRTIFTSHEFTNASPRLKRPYRFMISALRALAVELEPKHKLHWWLVRLGQPLFMWPSPDGYPEEMYAWADKLLPRWNFALQLAQNKIQGVYVPWENLVQGTLEERIGQIAYRLFARELDQASWELIWQHVKGQRREQRAFVESVALMLSSPAFQWM